MTASATARQPAERGEARAADVERSVRSVRPALLLQRRCACGSGAGGSGECDSCAKPSLLQRHASGGAAAHADGGWPAAVHDTLARPGRSLDSDTRAFMESRFGGHDFGAVRVHDDAAAAQSAREVDAHAYTVGPHIVFGAGQYQPGSDSGRHLLAHELAHTVQQQGLQRAGTTALADHGPEYRRLEGEADRAADAVMRGGPLPGLSAGGERLSRKPAAGKVTTTEDLGYRKKNADPKKRVNLTIESAPNLMGYVKTSGKTAEYSFDVLRLPSEKGVQAKAAYVPSKLKAEFEQGSTRPTPKGNIERDPTDTLRKSWLSLRKSTDADADWAGAGGGKAFPELKTGTSPCEVDHLQELQVGGTNDPANLQLLTKENNGASGNLLSQQLRLMAEAALEHAQGLPGKPDTVRLSFARVELAGAPKPDTCLNIGQAFDVATGSGKALTPAVDFDMQVGSQQATLKLPKDNSTTIDLESSPYAQNIAFAWSVKPLVFEQLSRPKGKPPNKLSFRLDTVAMKLSASKHGGSHSIPVSASGKADLKQLPKAGIPFDFSKLSPGVLTSLDTGANGLVATGTIKPSLPFLPQLGVAVDGPNFKVTTALDPKKMPAPIPGLRFTKAELALQLAPEFKPEGTLAFDIGPADKRVASGQIVITADDKGIKLDGDLYAHLPGVDQAKGEVHMSGGVWTGSVHIESGQMAGKIPFVKSGSVDVVVQSTSQGGRLGASGKVDLALPGDNQASVELRYRENSWQFIGRGRFHTKSPYLKPIDAELEYDGEVFTAKGSTGFTFSGLDGTVDATYVHRAGHEKITGKGKLGIKKGRANGDINVELLPSGNVTGKGILSYEIKKGMVATAGVTIDKDQKITFDGELSVPDITLFKRIPEKEETHTIFKASGSFPLPGASIGPLGLKIKLWGELGWYYYVGPGVLTGIKANVRFSPLEDNPDFSFKLSAKASIPAAAGVYGKFGADAVLDALIAEAGAGISVEARAGLEGKAELAADINYAKDRFAVDALASVEGGIVLSASLNAHVYAEAGVWRFKVRTEKFWELASRRFDTGLKLGVKLPLHYDSVDGFRMPALADIKRDPAQLNVDAPDLFGRMLDSSPPTKEKES